MRACEEYEFTLNPLSILKQNICMNKSAKHQKKPRQLYIQIYETLRSRLGVGPGTGMLPRTPASAEPSASEVRFMVDPPDAEPVLLTLAELLEPNAMKIRGARCIEKVSRLLGML